MTKTVARRRSPNPVAMKMIQYLTAQKEAKEVGKRVTTLKEELRSHVEQFHETDPEKGHHIHTLPEAIDFLGQKYTGFMNQKKAGQQVFLEDKAEALASEKGWRPDVYTSRYVDQDKIVRLYADDKITQEEFDSLYETGDPTWAFVPVKE